MTHGVKAAVCAALLLVAGAAGAVELRFGDSVAIPASDKSSEDILAAGRTISIKPHVPGDVTAFGQRVSVTRGVGGSVLLVGQKVDLTGPVGNDAWLAGQDVTMNSRIADNACAAGSTVVLGKNASTGRDLLVAGGEVYIQGRVGRTLRAAAAELVIAGTVEGDVCARAGTVTLLDTAVIKGNLFYESPNRLRQYPGAKLMGRVEHKLPPREKTRPVFWSGFALWLGRLIAAVIFGVALLSVFPERSEQAARTLARSPWSSLGVGLVVAIVVPVACAIGLISVVGIPLVIAVLFVYAILLYAAGIFTSLALGVWLMRRGGRSTVWPLGSMILGALVLGLVFAVPILGWLAKLGAVLLGLGAFCVSWWRSRNALPATAQPKLPMA
ncbi:MAG: hypothetical protein ACP5R5_03105 [Armatimonadota bacterium]